MPYYGAMTADTVESSAPSATLSQVRRELLWAALALLLGLLAMPALIWTAGKVSLGPYGNGGLLALFRDYLGSLAAGSLAGWIVLLGPWVVLSLGRLLREVLKALARCN